jgi:rubrerythrin
MKTENIVNSILKNAMDFTKVDQVQKAKELLDDREIMRALRLAIAAEHDATSLYENLSDSIENTAIKELLQDIANEEKVHVGELTKALQMLDKTDEKFINKGKDEAKEKTEA